jgi:hypothetical protein
MRRHWIAKSIAQLAKVEGGFGEPDARMELMAVASTALDTWMDNDWELTQLGGRVVGVQDRKNAAF